MDPIDYEVKESARAKHVRLKVSLYDASLVVVVPRGFDRKCIPEVLEEKWSWIERARRDVIEQRRLVGAEPQEEWPEVLQLRALGEQWSVEYRRGDEPKVRASAEGGRRLVLGGGVDDAAACQQALGEWVKAKAKASLVPWLLRASETQELPVGRVAVRAQRTCWATCSPRRTISVNRKLLFLPARLVDYVFTHELCHLTHMNHSRRFWALVGKRAPDYRARELDLRTAWRYVPAWMGAEGKGKA